VLLAIIGVAIVVKSLFASSTEEPLSPFRWRPLVIVVAAILVFALALPRLGMIVTLPLLIVVISTASEQFRWCDVVVNGAVLTLGFWAVFIKGLQLTTGAACVRFVKAQDQVVEHFHGSLHTYDAGGFKVGFSHPRITSARASSK
jgi:hypothetical protein